MDTLYIEGGRRLEGRVEVPAAKNAALPLLCLSLLTDQPVIFQNIPKVADIQNLIQLLAGLGVEFKEDKILQCHSIKSTTAPYDLVRKMRASVLVLGPLLARAGKAIVSLPGGCAIGERPVDIHLKGMQALGAQIKIESGYIHAEAKSLKGTRFVLSFPTVTGTINIVTAAIFAKGETVLENVAREPEVVEVCEALNAMGAKIEGHGTTKLRIQGVEGLRGTEWTIQPDRIQLLTYLAAGAMTGGSVECRPYRKETMDAVLQKFQEMGCEVNEAASSVSLRAPKGLRAVNIDTAPFPGFPTDAQAQFMACLTVAEGSSAIRETIFESRFNHVPELRRMGAQIDVKGNLAIVKGVPKLSAASVMASDLRASASLVLGALRAEGKSQILRVYHLDRGYENFDQRLNSLGAKVWREKV